LGDEHPKENHEAALETARRALLETAAERGATNPELSDICSKGLVAKLNRPAIQAPPVMFG
jgi:hypothetical protein